MLILGTAQVNPKYGVTRQTLGPAPRNDFEDLLNSARQLGIEALDTASAYTGAHALIQESYWDGPIHTKISNLDNASEELESAKKELGRNLLDLVYFHDSSIAISGPRVASAVSRELLDNGVLEVGISIYSRDEFEAALRLPEISVIQVPLNPLDQRFAGPILDRAQQSGKKVIARSLFLQGLLLSPLGNGESLARAGLSPYLRNFFETCKEAHVSPLHACLDFVLGRPQLFGFIVGLENLAQALDLIATLASVKEGEKRSINFDELGVEDHSLIDPRQWV